MGGPQEQKWPRICSNSKHKGERLVFIPYKPSLINQTACGALCFALTLPWMPSPVEAILDQRMLKASLLACRRASATSSRALLAVVGSWNEQE